MWENLFDLLAQLLTGTGTRSTADPSPGPPVDVGSAMVLLGLGVFIGARIEWGTIAGDFRRSD
jgi:hypothetical protein